jgi:hypothetical protein
MKCAGHLDYEIHPRGVRIEDELQIRQPDEIKSTNDLIVKVILETNLCLQNLVQIDD